MLDAVLHAPNRCGVVCRGVVRCDELKRLEGSPRTAGAHSDFCVLDAVLHAPNRCDFSQHAAHAKGVILRAGRSAACAQQVRRGVVRCGGVMC